MEHDGTMVFLEMSRVDSHGGGSWSFPNCIWAPTEKQGGGSWPFWTKVLAVRGGDTVLHLRGIQPNAYFVGYSLAVGDGFTTSQRPPNAGIWSFSKTFNRADLDSYTPFHKPVSLTEVFLERHAELDAYFDENKLSSDKKNIFYVRQSGKLQCLNGAYLSDIDELLLRALFGPIGVGSPSDAVVSIETGSQLATIQRRLGQSTFSSKIKALYGNRCCFPSCEVDDPRFLVGAHIARWSDNPTLRGNMGNGLCLCVFHDKAFELGLFTLSDKFQIYLNPKEVLANSGAMKRLLPFDGRQVDLPKIHPLADALLEHWIRIKVSP